MIDGIKNMNELKMSFSKDANLYNWIKLMSAEGVKVRLGV